MEYPSLQNLLDGHRVVLVNRSATYAIGCNETMPLAGIVSMEHGAEYPWLEQRLGVPILSWNQHPGWRLPLPDEAVEYGVPALDEPLSALVGAHGARTSIWCPRLCRSAWEFAEAHGLRNLCAEPTLGSWLADKRNALPAMRSLGLPVLEGEWIRAGLETYTVLRGRFGQPFVLQTPMSSAGAGTSIIYEEPEYLEACERAFGGTVWVAPYAGDLSLNINACDTDDDGFVAYTSVQLNGLGFANARPAQYCGNDYAATANLSETLLRDLAGQTHRVGEWIRGMGYRGIYGLDFVLGVDGRFHPVDLNARWQGSTALLGQAEQRAGSIPLGVLSLAARLGLLSRAELQRHGERSMEPVEASQFFLWSPEVPAECMGEVRSGVYSLPASTGEGPQWMRPDACGAWINDPARIPTRSGAGCLPCGEPSVGDCNRRFAVQFL